MIMEEGKIYRPGTEYKHLKAIIADMDDINSHIVAANQHLGIANDKLFDLRNKINRILMDTKEK